MNLTDDLSQYGQGITGLTGGVAAAQYATASTSKSNVICFKYGFRSGRLVSKNVPPSTTNWNNRLMRTLTRPMFNMGGPIKQGVMHGIREPKKNGGAAAGLVGDQRYPKTKGREHHGLPFAL